MRRSLNSLSWEIWAGRAKRGFWFSKQEGHTMSVMLSTILESHCCSLRTRANKRLSGCPKFLWIFRICDLISWGKLENNGPWVWHLCWESVSFSVFGRGSSQLTLVSEGQCFLPSGSSLPSRDFLFVGCVSTDGSVWIRALAKTLINNRAGGQFLMACLRVIFDQSSQSLSLKVPDSFRWHPIDHRRGADCLVIPTGGKRYRSAPLHASMAAIW